MNHLKKISTSLHINNTMTRKKKKKKIFKTHPSWRFPKVQSNIKWQQQRNENNTGYLLSHWCLKPSQPAGLSPCDENATQTHLSWRIPTTAAGRSRSTWAWCTWTSQSGVAVRTCVLPPPSSCPAPESQGWSACGWNGHGSAPAACWQRAGAVQPRGHWGTGLPVCPTGTSTSAAGGLVLTPDAGSPVRYF